MAYLFNQAIFLSPEPPPSRFLWHLFFHPGLNGILRSIKNKCKSDIGNNALIIKHHKSQTGKLKNVILTLGKFF